MKIWLFLLLALLLCTDVMADPAEDDSGNTPETDEADDSGNMDQSGDGGKDEKDQSGTGKIPDVVEKGVVAGREIVDIFSEFGETDTFYKIQNIVPKLKPFFDALEEVIRHPAARIYFSSICVNMTEVVTEFSVMDDLAEEHKDMKKLKEDYARYEHQISTLMTKFGEYLKASEEDQDVFKRTFIQTYTVAKKKSPRRHLLNGLEMDIPKRSMANTKNHRKKVQDIMKRMLVNIIHGSIVQLAYTRSEFPDSYDSKLKEHVAEIAKLIPTMISWDEKVKYEWVRQAGMDIRKTVFTRKRGAEILADTLFTTLKEKYDWRAWNILVFKKGKPVKEIFYRYCDAFIVRKDKMTVIAASVEKSKQALGGKRISELIGKIKTKCSLLSCNLAENLYSPNVPGQLMNSCRDVSLLVISKKWGKDVEVRGSKERTTTRKNGKFMFFAFS